RHGHVCGQAAADAAVVGDHRAEGGMERDKCAAPDGHRCGRASHHVVIASPVVWVLVADGADGGEFVERLGEIWDRLAEMHAWYAGRDGAEGAADFRRRVGLRIECLVMRWTAIHPDHDAVDVL